MGVIVWDLEGVCPRTGCPAPWLAAAQTSHRKPVRVTHLPCPGLSKRAGSGTWGPCAWAGGGPQAPGKRCVRAGYSLAPPGWLTRSSPAPALGSVLTGAAGETPILKPSLATHLLSVGWAGGANSPWERRSRLPRGKEFVLGPGSTPESAVICGPSGRASGCGTSRARTCRKWARWGRV